MSGQPSAITFVILHQESVDGAYHMVEHLFYFNFPIQFFTKHLSTFIGVIGDEIMIAYDLRLEVICFKLDLCVESNHIIDLVCTSIQSEVVHQSNVNRQLRVYLSISVCF